MKRVCCICGKEMGRSGEGGAEAGLVTHGYCDPCYELFLGEELGESLQAYLDRLPVPVLAVESGISVTTANRKACSLLGKELSEIEQRRPGDLIDCVHSRSPGGCGSTIHCESCTIRNTVLETFATGTSQLNVRAYPDVQSGREVKNVCLQISTEKVGELVLLRIDELRENEVLT